MIRFRCRGMSLAFLVGVFATAGLHARGASWSDRIAAQQQAQDVVWKLDKAFNQTWVTEVKQTLTTGSGAAKKTVQLTRTVTTKLAWAPKKPVEGAKSREFDLTVTSIALETKYGTPTVEGDEKTIALKSDSAEGSAPLAVTLAKLNGLKLGVKITPGDGAPKVEVMGLPSELGKLTGAEQKAVKEFVSAEVLERTIRASFPDLKKDAPAQKGELTSTFGDYSTETTWTFKESKEKKSGVRGLGEVDVQREGVPDRCEGGRPHRDFVGVAEVRLGIGTGRRVHAHDPDGSEAVLVTVTRDGKPTEVEVRTSYSQKVTTAPATTPHQD